ncbi:uncharacterized protein LOC120457267 [Drosophila santomea]|uniref:uncharacterized protein LOC120457267 n=1 Tax=Drosophila santomea TaxID=129105 RepID=UPI001952E815|nr:uncharacterized protein LOC120457267 [Drosophila santomea]
MNKYFNTEILHSLVAQVPVVNQDLDKDPCIAMEPAARYVLYVSFDPSRELHPRKVRKNLRNLFGKKETSQGCVVRIREEKLSVLKLDLAKTAEPKSLEEENASEKPPDMISRGGSQVDTKSTPSTSIIHLDKRASGGRNITFDPKIIFENKSIECIEVLHHNSKFNSSSCSPRMLEIYKEKLVVLKWTNQMSIRETSSESSQYDDWNNRQLTQETRQQLNHPVDYFTGHWNARSYLDWLRNSDCEVIKSLCQNNFVGACTNTTSIESVSNPTQSNHVEKFRHGLGYCLRIVGQFFSTGEEEEEMEAADQPIRPYVDREHYAPLVLGPTIDESIAFLVDRVMIAIKWAMSAEVRPSDNAEEPEQLLPLLNGHRSTGEEEQQLGNGSLTSMETSTHVPDNP